MHRPHIRPTFTLRALFLAVTVVGLWLGYHLHWINERHRAIDEQRISWFSVPNMGSPIIPPTPWCLRLFGERNASDALIAQDPIAEKEYERIKTLFPGIKVFNGLSDAEQSLD